MKLALYNPPGVKKAVDVAVMNCGLYKPPGVTNAVEVAVMKPVLYICVVETRPAKVVQSLPDRKPPCEAVAVAMLKVQVPEEEAMVKPVKPEVAKVKGAEINTLPVAPLTVIFEPALKDVVVFQIEAPVIAPLIPLMEVVVL